MNKNVSQLKHYSVILRWHRYVIHHLCPDTLFVIVSDSQFHFGDETAGVVSEYLFETSFDVALRCFRLSVVET